MGLRLAKRSHDGHRIPPPHGTRALWAGGDQGLLNTFFNTWNTGSAASRLPFVYNMTANAR
jgi:hypothetical protein